MPEIIPRNTFTCRNLIVPQLCENGGIGMNGFPNNVFSPKFPCLFLWDDVELHVFYTNQTRDSIDRICRGINT
jgi:hypothetical protein